MFILTPIVAIIFFTFIVNAVIFIISWRRKNSKSGLYFALAMLSVTVWSLMSALDYAATPLTLKIFFAKMEAVGYHSAIALLAVSSILYAGNERWLEKKWVEALFFFIPFTNILLTVTNEMHHLIWSGFIPKENNLVVFQYGSAFEWEFFSDYALIIFIFINLLMAYVKGSTFTRKQTALLGFALTIPIVANTMYQFSVGKVEGVDWSSVTFSVTGVIMLYALYGMHFMDVIPIARDKLFNNFGDGMVVLDTQNRIIDLNNVAAEIINKPAIGENLEQITPLTRSMLKQPLEKDLKTTIKTENPPQRYFDVRLSPLLDGKNHVIGRLLIFRDITELKENEMRLLQLTQAVEQSPLSIEITDLTGAITYVNPQFTELTGYTSAEVIGKNSNVQKSGKTPAETYKDMWSAIKAGRTWKGEILNKKKNGELYWEQSTVAPIFDYEAQIINYLALKTDITDRKQAENDMQQRLLEIERLNQELQESQAQVVDQQRSMATIAERQRLARDMHDSVNQSIHSLMLFSETLVALLKKNRVQEALQTAERIQESGQRALKEIRLMLYRAQSVLISENTDLITALEERLNMVERRVGITAKIIGADETRKNYPTEWTDNLYWIIMEALNNSLKYSQAQNVKIFFKHDGKQIEVEVADDGAGFDPKQIQVGGYGMKSMRERSELLGGCLTITSAPSCGTRVQIKIETE